MDSIDLYTGWWFGTWLLWLSHSVGKNWECHHPNWRTPSFFRGIGQPPTSQGFPWVLTFFCMTSWIFHCHVSHSQKVLQLGASCGYDVRFWGLQWTSNVRGRNRRNPKKMWDKTHWKRVLFWASQFWSPQFNDLLFVRHMFGCQLIC